MSIGILYSLVGSLGARTLSAFMGQSVQLLKSREARILATPLDHLIRWGSHAPIRWKPRISVCNRREELRLQSNKVEQLLLLRTAGVTVPTFSTSVDGILDNRRQPAKIMSRNTTDHRNRQMYGGRGIDVHPRDADGNYNLPPDRDLYMLWSNKHRQFRVHVVRGRTLVRELHWERDEPKPEIWNHQNGFVSVIPDLTRTNTLRSPTLITTKATHAVAALGLDFGAVDVMVTTSGGIYVLEVNTAPGLKSPAVIEFYAKNLAAGVGLDPDDMPGIDAVDINLDPVTPQGGNDVGRD